jgi:hypothetical protein
MYMADPKVTTKMSFDFTPEDMKVLNTLKRQMAATQGRVSVVAVIRAAIRKAAAK